MSVFQTVISIFNREGEETFMKNILLRLLTVTAAMLTAVSFASAQVATGMPAFGSFGGGPFDTINLGNLNVHFAVPIIHKTGRGLPFDYALSYDNSIWYPVGAQGSQTWQPISSFGWQGLSNAGIAYIGYSMTYYLGHCGYMGQSTYQQWTYNNFVYHDEFGARHGFGQTLYYFVSPGGSCPPNGPQPPTPPPVVTTDGSGYTLYTTVCSGSASA
jgi:hypothetical protein